MCSNCERQVREKEMLYRKEKQMADAEAAMANLKAEAGAKIVNETLSAKLKPVFYDRQGGALLGADCYGEALKTQPGREIWTMLAKQEKAVALLNEYVEQLGVRLSGVLEPEDPQIAGNPANPVEREALTAVGQAVEQSTASIAVAYRKLDDIIKRIGV